MKIIRWIWAIPKTIYLNFKVFNFSTAIKFPIICSHKVKIKKISKDCIYIQGPIKRGMIRFAMSDGSFSNGRIGTSIINIAKGGQLIFTGEGIINNYFSLNIGSNGVVKFGDNFFSNYGLLISCSKKIEFGSDTIVGWNCSFIDGDGHKIFDGNNTQTNIDKPISIGNHVWIASNVVCLKGVTISDNIVVAQSAVLTKSFNQENCVLGGSPAKIIKTGVSWMK